jgi:hypothetical protein
MGDLVQNKNNFVAAMTESELEQGEINHRSIEKCRKLIMATGLTKSSAELRGVCSSDISSHSQVLKLALEATEHYENVIDLLGGCVARIYDIYQEFEHMNPMLLNNREIEAIQDIIESREHLV